MFIDDFLYTVGTALGALPALPHVILPAIVQDGQELSFLFSE